MQQGLLRSSRPPAIAPRGARPVVLPPAPTFGTAGVVRQPQLRGGVVAKSSIEFVEDISKEEAAQFERIAAALVAKLANVQDYVEDEEGEGEEDDLVPFGASAAEVAARQARLAQRRSGAAAGSSSAASAGGMNGLTLAAGPKGYVSGRDRKRRIPDDLLPKVAIVGRPNVGKSALFNRIAGSAVAVVYDQPGVTRDRLYTRAFWGDKEFVMIDTGGLMSDATRLPPDVRKQAMKSISAEGLPEAIERQAAAGVGEADTVILLVDGQSGLQPGDEEILSWLRSNHPGKSVLLAVNKCENSAKADQMVADFWGMGLEPRAVSAITGTGTGELLDALAAVLPPPKGAEEDDEVSRGLAVAIVGRPNVVPSTSAPSAPCRAARNVALCPARSSKAPTKPHRYIKIATALSESQSVETARQVLNPSGVEDDVLIEFIDVHKSFGDKPILRGASFKIRRGEAVGIIGASGTGKSTTLRLAAGLLACDKGIVKIQGVERKGLLSDGNEDDQHLRIGMVFQNAALFDSLTVGENVGFLLYEHSSLPDAKIKELVADSLAKVGLRGVEQLYPSELSGGMKKRVALARAVVSDQRQDSEQLIMYDEPTAGLDPVASTVVEDLMRSLHVTSADADGKTNGISSYIVVTHQHSTIRRAVDRIIFLHQGKVVWEGSVKEFDTTDEPIVRQFAEGSLEGPISYV
ncbi:hypothetical protein HYH03_015497 [Edaphochlamys debaryana]|uniref:Uncharacterized protein n=1 Tax=Edaphochlamys debaryana TaxID=47281 RepID=A0A836BQU7_9CHLO|nr:hypothetical protein HYH03_015497 [Edaphochlamys debaryana]|eukprot:KAG2485786.1 hypothetical protein HYH03_015497 [Edaphochlamys debaryana]